MGSRRNRLESSCVHTAGTLLHNTRNEKIERRSRPGQLNAKHTHTSDALQQAPTIGLALFSSQDMRREVLVRRCAGRNILHFFAAILVLSCVSTARSQATEFCMLWDEERLYNGPLKDAPTALHEPHPIYACTAEPEIPFCPNCENKKGKTCAAGDSCHTCRGICESFDRGAHAAIPPDQETCHSSQVTGLEKFPAECFSRVQTVEDQLSPLGTYLGYVHNASGVLVCRGLDDPREDSFPSETVTVKASVRWGYLDVYGQMERCRQLDIPGGECVYENIEGISEVRFETMGEILEEVRSLQLTGSYEAVMNGMLNMSFVPLELFNTLRVRHFQINPTSTRVQPWFQVEYRWAMDGADLRAGPDHTQLIDVLSVNNAPSITDPQEGYIQGCKTSTPCGTEFSKYAREDVLEEREDFYFGQYWRREGSFEPVSVTGLAIEDPDVDETCYFNPRQACNYLQDAEKNYRCGKLDFNARALIGTIALNTRDNVEFYQYTRSSIGLTAELRYIAVAIRSITYRVDRPELIATGTSEVLNTNTQFVGAPEEFIFLRLSDQGLTGADGVAKVARDPRTGELGLRVNVTIVAVNDEPALFTAAPDFTASEDVPLDLEGLEVADPDADEVITSEMALVTWMNERSNSRYLNRIRLTVELKGFGNDKARGMLFLNEDVREIFVVSNFTQMFVSVDSLFPGNAACRALPLLSRPGPFVCDGNSPNSTRGRRCGDESDDSCNLVSRGAIGEQSSRQALQMNHSQWAQAWVDVCTRLNCSKQSSAEEMGEVKVRLLSGMHRGLEAMVVDVNQTHVVLAEPLFNQTRGGDGVEVWFVDGAAGCEYRGLVLEDFCAFTTNAELAKFWGGYCERGAGAGGEDLGCECAGDLRTTCAAEGKYLVHLNRSQEGVQGYVDQLTGAMREYEKTCGGLAVRRSEFPLNTSLAKRCNSDDDCADSVFPKCTPGVDCFCCGNVSHVCSDNTDCALFSAPFDIAAATCGCTPGVTASAITDTFDDLSLTYCCANITERCTTDDECTRYLNGSKCGCIPGYPICGPWSSPLEPDIGQHPGYGQPCTYRGVFQDANRMAAATVCESDMFVYEGTRNARIRDQLIFYQNDYNTGVLQRDRGRGSMRIEFYASIKFAILAVRGLKYLTNNPNYPNYNRLYRLPVEERDPTTFKIDANDFDVLHLTANDMGNSGGSDRDIKEVSTSLPIVVQAVNNPPVVNAPARIVAEEDVPVSIIHDPDQGIEGIFITDPDQQNFGFNDPRLIFGESLGFTLNLTVEHGCLFVNEQFLRFGPEYAAREEDRAVLGGPACALDTAFDVGGCTIRLKDYGQPKYGLHAVRCLDQQCRETEMAPCYSDQRPSAAEYRHCYGRMCTKFLALEGRFPDINALLSNVTYLSDPDFNTAYGYREQLRIEVSDNGIIGDAPVYAYSASATVEVEVLPVNDPPVIGRLDTTRCINFEDDGTYSLADWQQDTRLFRINPAVDFIDVNEDTIFTVMPDRLWIADVDSEEAEIRSTHVLQCAGACGSVSPDPQIGCCLAEQPGCAVVCEKTMLTGALPSEVLVEFRVERGKVSFFPPPTRPLIAGLTALRNLTLVDIKSGGEIWPCEDQAACMRNQTRIWVRGRLTSIQQALRWGYLTYIGPPFENGDDTLTAWCSDQGYSDLYYNRSLAAIGSVPIDIIAVNNAPVVTYPGGQGCICSATTGQCTCEKVPPLLYTKGEECLNDWMKYSFLDPWPEGEAIKCDDRNLSSIPNQRDTYLNFPELGQALSIQDVDLFETPFGNITFEVTIGRPNAGDFQITRIFSTITYYQWYDADELLHLQMRGPPRDLNIILGRLLYNARDDYSGPAPFLISVSDNNNYGICTPPTNREPYRCSRSFCRNIASGSTLETNFICGQPAFSDSSLTTFLPGASTSCSDVRLSTDDLTDSPGQIALDATADWPWSSPWSCLACGYYNPATRQVVDSPEGNPSIPGLTRASVDLVVGGAPACKMQTCTECNAAPISSSGPHGDGCGWCPSFCGGRGKCMIGRGKPIFETCLPDPVTGLRYRQCRAPELNLPLLISIVLLAVLGGGFAIYTAARWIQRRHGSVMVYVRKKRFDITYTGRKLNLLPPETASWREFFYLILVALLMALMYSGAFSAPGGPFFFQQEVYLDELTSIHMDLDNCNLRFLPTRNFTFPTNAINAIKIRFAYPVDPEITLESDTCNPATTFKLNNQREPAEKYTDFYCNVQILIPDRFVVPSITINAIGNNLTTVRAGPMDEDTRNFGLEFGSNEFVMTGERMVSRIENVSAKHLKYDVLHGSLLATNITLTPFATFNSLDADMVVTTDRQTTVKFWQKSANLVCLSAATAYIDNSCSQVCDFVPQDGDGEASSASTATVERDYREVERYYRRNLPRSANVSYSWTDNASQGGGPANRRLLQTTAAADACPGPIIPDCINEDCSVVDSDLCRCRETCDIVPPEELDFNNISGVEGSCNAAGECCREICEGYSTADLFPFPKTVRCGLCQDQAACSPPTCGTWTPGNLEQQWWFTSRSGQISLSVLDIETNPTPLHSYKGSPASDAVSITPDFSYADKVALDTLFHAGGKQAPALDWMWLRPYGPGSPPRTLGSFAWLASIRFLVLPDYFLQVVSNSQLNPQKGAASAGLRPGYCPPVLKEGDPQVNRRIIELFELFSDTIQRFPSPPKPLPDRTLIVWIPVKGAPTQFVRDPSTNQIGFSVINQWSGDGPVLLLVVILTFLIPVMLSTAAILALYFALRRRLKEYRKNMLEAENTLFDIWNQARLAQMPEHDAMAEQEIPFSRIYEMRARTNFFYLLDTYTGAAGAAKTLTREMLSVLFHLLIVAIPVVYVNYVAAEWKAANQAYFCESRVDQDRCYGEEEAVSQALTYVTLVAALVATAEIACYYLTIPYTAPRRILRVVFYVSFVFYCWIAISLVLLNAIWIYLGVLQQPAKLGPYALAAVGIVAIVSAHFGKLRRFQLRVQYQVKKRLVLYTDKMSHKFPRKVITMVLDKNMENAMQESGMSLPSIIINCFLLTVLLSALFSFVFIGFQAFTDPSEPSTGQLNCSITLIIILGLLSLVQGGNDRAWAEEQTNFTSEQVVESMGRVLVVIQEQLTAASRIIHQVKYNRYGLPRPDEMDSEEEEAEEEEDEEQGGEQELMNPLLGMPDVNQDEVTSLDRMRSRYLGNLPRG